MSDEPNEYNFYSEQRRTLNEAEFKIAETLDKSLLILSGGAMGVSMAFVRDFAENPRCICVLAIAWIMFGFCIATLLITNYLSQLAYRDAREKIDENYQKSISPDMTKNSVNTEETKWSKATKIGNLLGMIFFLVGLISLGIFIIVNTSSNSI